MSSQDSHLLAQNSCEQTEANLWQESIRNQMTPNERGLTNVSFMIRFYEVLNNAMAHVPSYFLSHGTITVHSQLQQH